MEDIIQGHGSLIKVPLVRRGRLGTHVGTEGQTGTGLALCRLSSSHNRAACLGLARHQTWPFAQVVDCLQHITDTKNKAPHPRPRPHPHPPSRAGGGLPAAHCEHRAAAAAQLPSHR